MSNKLIETITVDALTKYGVKVSGKNYNYSKFYNGEALVAGNTYEVETYTSDKGAIYINSAKLVGSTSRAQVSVSQSAPKTVSVGGQDILVQSEAKQSAPALTYAEKDVRILTQGIVQAVVQSPFLTSSDKDEDFLNRVKAISLELIKFVKEQK